MKTHTRILAMLVGLMVLFAIPAMAGSATSQIASGTETPDFSVNVELTVADETVTGITVYSATGETLLTVADLGGQTPQEALLAVLAQIGEAGYLAAGEDDATLMITTVGGILNADLAADLRALARETLRTKGSDVDVDYTAIGADVSAKAATLGLPGGRYLMMAYVAQSQGITVEEAIAQYGSLKVRELMQTFEGLREAMNQNELQEQEQEEEQEAEQEQEKEQGSKSEKTPKTEQSQDNGNGNGNSNKGGSKK